MCLRPLCRAHGVSLVVPAPTQKSKFILFISIYLLNVGDDDQYQVVPVPVPVQYNSIIV